MKKKIILLLIFIVTFMGFGMEAKAIDDHSLLYDVSSFVYDKSTITINGFAALHNYNNNDSEISIYFVDSNGNTIKNFEVKKTSISLTKWYCSRIGNECSSSSYNYDNVGFTASLNLTDFFNSSEFKYNTEYTLQIKVCLEGRSRCLDDTFGVPKGVVNGNNDDIKITNSTNTMTIYTQYSRLLSNNWGYGTIQSGSVYWTQYKEFNIVGIREGENNCNSGSTQYDYCPNLYELSYKKLNNLCVNSSNKGISGSVFPGSDCSAWASGAWGKPNGKVTISFKNGDPKPDSVCINEDKSINSCSSANLSYNCDKMKIKTTSNGASDGTILTAYVKIKEYGRFTMTSYAGDNVEVIAGQGFPIGMSYMYYLSWEMSDIVCNGFDEGKCHNMLYDNLKKISFKNVSSGTLQRNLNTTGVTETAELKKNTDENLSSAGSWECNGQLDEHAEGETSGGATIICQYKIKDAYIDFDTGYITYKDKSGQDRFKNLGSYFYIPLNYSDPTFSWNVVSDNISLVKVRTVKENYSLSTSHNWNINTNDSLDDSGNVKSGCYVNVKKGSFGPPNPDPDVPGDDGINIVYRSVDTDISSDESTLDSNLKLYYLEEGTNWYNYFYDINNDGNKSLNRSHFNRIKTSFNNLHYSTNSKIKSLLKDYDSESYTNWKNVDSNGISEFISSDYFDVIKNRGNIHCKWGEFNKLTCDNYNN